MENHRDIHRVAVIDENGRKTEEEYARDRNVPLSRVQNRFAATGTLKCADGYMLTAQLTGSTGVITTAAHGFFSLIDCSKRAEPKSCTFQVKIGGSVRTSKISSLEAIGTKCPTLSMYSDDWAVLKIDPPLHGIDPYGLPRPEDIQADKDVIAVAAQARDFTRKDSRGRKVMPKSIEECQLKYVEKMGGPVMLQSNCDNAQGGSGGSMLSNVGGRDVLLGVASRGDETPAMLERALKNNTVNSGPFKIDDWATYHVPLSGRFLRAVESAVGGQSI